jgi:hypothetical protein
MKALLVTLGFCSVMVLPARTEAQAEVHREITVDSLDSSKLEVGAHVRVTGKYKELVGNDLHLYGGNLPCTLERQDLIKRALDFKTHRDNVTVVGTVVQGPTGKALEVQELLSAESDFETFTREVEILSRGTVDSRQDFAALLKRILSTYEYQADRELVPLILKVFKLSLPQGPAPLEPATLEEKLKALQEIHRVVRDPEVALELALELERGTPRSVGVLGFLKGLHCLRYAGTWVTYETFKRREGFVELDGRWVKPWERHFQQTLQELGSLRQTNMVLRRRTDREYRILAENGTVEEGMKPQEVTAAWGLPDRVERRILLGKEVDQWAYGRKFCYFHEGVLVKKPGQ